MADAGANAAAAGEGDLQEVAALAGRLHETQSRLQELSGGELDAVLLNLCVNARDAMPGGGKISITAENLVIDDQYAGMNPDSSVGAYILLQVEDTGTGIAPGDIERIFDPFFTTKKIDKGTGLGLSTTAAIIKRHGGFLRVDSEVGQGTQFQVYLPAQTDPAARAASEEPPALPCGHGELILVVDDEEGVRLVTQRTLEAFGYRAIVATDGGRRPGPLCRPAR